MHSSFLDTEPFGPTTAVIDHCDRVETFLGGGGIIIADQTDNQINLTVTNSIIIEDAFAIVVNGDPANSNVTLRNNTIVADVSQVEGEADVQENILDVDPMYGCSEWQFLSAERFSGADCRNRWDISGISAPKILQWIPMVH